MLFLSPSFLLIPYHSLSHPLFISLYLIPSHSLSFPPNTHMIGTMSPFEHGETFVLDDGGETDLDLGNYER